MIFGVVVVKYGKMFAIFSLWVSVFFAALSLGAVPARAESTGSLSLTSTATACDMGYIYFQDSSSAKAALDKGEDAIQSLGSSLSIAEFASGSHHGYILIFVRPEDNTLVTSLTTAGAGDIYSTNGTEASDYGNISDYPYVEQFAALAKGQGYTIVLGYHRKPTNINNISGDVSATGQTPEIKISAEADKTTGVIPGDTIEFKVTVTPGELEGIDKTRLTTAEPEVSEITINGVAVTVPAFTKQSDGSYVGTVSYKVTAEDCEKELVSFYVKASVLYKFILGSLSAGVQVETTIESEATATSMIAERNNVTYVYRYDTGGSTVTNYKPCGAVPVDTTDYFKGNTVAVQGRATGERRLDVADSGWWEFQGWTLDGASYEAGDTFTMPSGTVTLYGTWKFIKATPVVDVDSYTYDGTPASDHIVTSDSGFSADITGQVSYTWYKRIVDGYGYDWAGLDSAPTAVGIYQVVATWTIDGEGTVSAQDEFRILPTHDPYIEATGWTYDAVTTATSHVNAVSGYGEFATKEKVSYEVYDAETQTWNAMETVPMHAGSYRVCASWTVNGEAISAGPVTFVVSPWTIVLTSDSDTKPSSAEPLTCERLALVDGEMVGGDTYEVVNYASTSALGTVNNTFDVSCTYATGRASDYVIERVYGTLTVTPLAVTYAYVYEAPEGAGIGLVVPTDSNGYLYGATVELPKPAGTVVDTANGGVWTFKGWKIGGQDVSGSFTIAESTTVTGVWTFAKAVPTVSISDWTYDGTDASGRLVAESGYGAAAGTPSVTWFKKDAATGAFEAVADAPADAGDYEVRVSWTVHDDLLGDVTVSEGAAFAIKQRPVYLASGDAWKNYDGEALACTDVTVKERTDESGFVGGDSYVAEDFATLTGSASEKSVAENTFTVEVSGNYLPKYTYGTLTVLPRVTVSYEYAYDKPDSVADVSACGAAPDAFVSKTGGTVVVAAAPNAVEDAKNDGVWTFEGWAIDDEEAPASFTMGERNVVITGTWTFTPTERHTVSYAYVSGTEGMALDGLGLVVPADETRYTVGETVAIASPASGTVVDTDNGGYWTFEGWKQDDATVSGSLKMGHADISLVGTWVFVKTATPSVSIKGWTYDGTDASGRVASSSGYESVSKAEPVYTYVFVAEDGTETTVGEAPKHAGAYRVTASWTIAGVTVTTAPAEFTIAKRPVAFTSEDAWKHYDGEALTCTTVTLAGELVAGDTYTVSNHAALLGDPWTETSIKNTFDVAISDDYAVSKSCGTLTVRPRVKDKSVSYEFRYEGRPLFSVGLPDAVTDAPADDARYATGQTVAVAAVDPVRVEDEANYGSWEFSGWTLDGEAVGETLAMGDANISLVGTWKFTYGPTYAATFAWSLDAPEGVTNDFAKLPALPETVEALKKGETFELPTLGTTRVLDGANNGWWDFAGWTVADTSVSGTYAIGASDVEVVGVWEFTKADTRLSVASWTYDKTGVFDGGRLSFESGYATGDCVDVSYSFTDADGNVTSDVVSVGTYVATATYTLANGETATIESAAFTVSPAQVVFESTGGERAIGFEPTADDVKLVEGTAYDDYTITGVTLHRGELMTIRFDVDFGSAAGNYEVVRKYGLVHVVENVEIVEPEPDPDQGTDLDPDQDTQEHGVTYVYEYDRGEGGALETDVCGPAPVDDATYAAGTEYVLKRPEAEKVVDGLNRGFWKFSGWTLDGQLAGTTAVMGDADVTYVGTWVFVPVESYVSVANWTYDATDAGSRIASDSGYGTYASDVQYVYEQLVTSAARSAQWEELDGAPTHAGTYRVTAYWTLPGGVWVSAEHEFCVTPAMLELTSGSLAKEYDGDALEHPEVAITAGQLYGNDSFTTSDFARLTQPGSVDNTFAVDLGDAEGDYVVKKQYGTLLVTEPVADDDQDEPVVPSDEEVELPDDDGNDDPEEGSGADTTTKSDKDPNGSSGEDAASGQDAGATDDPSDGGSEPDEAEPSEAVSNEVSESAKVSPISLFLPKTGDAVASMAPMLCAAASAGLVGLGIVVGKKNRK